MINLQPCLFFFHIINFCSISFFTSKKSHHSQHPLKYSKIRIITRRTIHSKFNCFKDMQILCDHFFSSSGHHFRFILKGSAPKSTKNHYFRIVQCGNIQNPGQSLLMDFQKFLISDFYCRSNIVSDIMETFLYG